MLSQTCRSPFLDGPPIPSVRRTPRACWTSNLQTSLLPQSESSAELLLARHPRHLASLQAANTKRAFPAPPPPAGTFSISWAGDPSNPSSIHSCLNAARARNAARRARHAHDRSMGDDQFDLARAEGRGLRGVETDPSQFFEWVKYRSHLSRGVMIGTMLRDEALYFSRLGTFLERARQQPARILDGQVSRAPPDQGRAPTTGAEGEGPRPGASIDFYPLGPRCCASVSAFEVYRKVYSNVITPRARGGAASSCARTCRARSPNCLSEAVTNLASVRNDPLARDPSDARACCRPTCTTAASTPSSSRACHPWLVNFLPARERSRRPASARRLPRAARHRLTMRLAHPPRDRVPLQLRRRTTASSSCA